MLLTAALDMVLLTAMYCSLAWFRNAHICLIDLVINNEL